MDSNFSWHHLLNSPPFPAVKIYFMFIRFMLEELEGVKQDILVEWRVSTHVCVSQMPCDFRAEGWGSSELLENRRENPEGSSGQQTRQRDTGQGRSGVSAEPRSSEQAAPSGIQLVGGQQPVLDVSRACGLGGCGHWGSQAPADSCLLRNSDPKCEKWTCGPGRKKP